MRLLNRYDEQIRQDALSMTERAFCNTYRHYDSEENLKRIQKDIQNEPPKEKRKEIVEQTDEAVDFPELPPVDNEKEKQSMKEIVAQTNEAQYEEYELVSVGEEVIKLSTHKATFESIQMGTSKTRAQRMKELIEEKLEKTDIKKIMEDEGYEFKGSIFHSEYRRLTITK